MDSLLKRIHSRRSSKKSTPSAQIAKPELSDSTLKANGTANGATNGVSKAEQPPEPQQPSVLEETKRSVFESVGQLRSLLKASQSPLPTQTGDGSALPQPEKAGFWKDVNEIIRDIPRQDINDVAGLIETVKLTALGQPMDDKEYLMESVSRFRSHWMF